LGASILVEVPSACNGSPGGGEGTSFLDGRLYIALLAAGKVAGLRADDDWATAAVETAPAMELSPVPDLQHRSRVL